MELVDHAQLRSKLGQQDALLESQQQQLLAVMQCVQTITPQMDMLSTAVQSAHSTSANWTSSPSASVDPGGLPDQAPTPGIWEPRLPAPERYDGSPGECRAFLTQCQIIFSLQPLTFPTDAARVAYIITQLTGKAKKWGTAAWSADLPCIRTSDRFMTEIHRVFDRSSTGLEAGRELLRLRQGKDSVSNYSIEFQMLAMDSGSGGRALIDAFLHGLSEEVKDELLTRDLPEDLDRIIAIAIHIDARLEDPRRMTKPRSPPPRRQYHQQQFSNAPNIQFPRSSPPRPRGEPEMMVVDHSRLHEEERYRCLRTRSCFYCGG